MRIRPKISEKPAARMNSTPPSARLLRLWISHRFMRGPLAASLLDALRRRVIARIHRAGEELAALVLPELAHRRIGLEHRVHQLAVLAFHLADVDIHGRIAQRVELDAAARVLCRPRVA